MGAVTNLALGWAKGVSCSCSVSVPRASIPQEQKETILTPLTTPGHCASTVSRHFPVPLHAWLHISIMLCFLSPFHCSDTPVTPRTRDGIHSTCCPHPFVGKLLEPTALFSEAAIPHALVPQPLHDWSEHNWLKSVQSLKKKVVQSASLPGNCN